ncbi:MAG: hypothetical protein JWP12_760 [Bacteroidetes bacterium]|nr:hypothetical protein [Bacteroidota bacterium]
MGTDRQCVNKNGRQNKQVIYNCLLVRLESRTDIKFENYFLNFTVIPGLTRDLPIKNGINIRQTSMRSRPPRRTG